LEETPGTNLSGNEHPLKQMVSTVNHYEAFFPDLVCLAALYLFEPESEIRFFLKAYQVMVACDMIR
jgi:hypothetical protein